MRTIKPVIRREITQDEIRSRLQTVRGGARSIRLQHLIIRNFDFSALLLRRAEFYNDILEGCRFRKAVLSGALLGELHAVASDFRGASWDDADVVWSVLRRSNFTAGNLTRVYFFNTDLASAAFRKADLKSCSFVQCDLTNADFTEARLESTEFLDCKLHGAKNLAECHLSYEPALFSQSRW